jgi:hypothetical protein
MSMYGVQEEIREEKTLRKYHLSRDRSKIFVSQGFIMC